MKMIHVAAAVIVRDGMVFCTRRGSGKNRGKWEFPGGKCEPGESCAEAAVREIREELAAGIEPGPEIAAVPVCSEDVELTVHFLLCRLADGEPVLLEHDAGMWVYPRKMTALDFMEADRRVLPQLISLFGESRTESHDPSESHH